MDKNQTGPHTTNLCRKEKKNFLRGSFPNFPTRKASYLKPNQTYKYVKPVVTSTDLSNIFFTFNDKTENNNADTLGNLKKITLSRKFFHLFFNVKQRVHKPSLKQ